MKKLFNLLIISIIFLLVNGCAANKRISKEEELSLALSNKNHKGYILTTLSYNNTVSDRGLIPRTIILNNNLKDDQFKYKLLKIPFSFTLNYEKDRYLIILELDGGNYRINSIRGISTYDWVSPAFEVPVCLDFNLNAGEIKYVGNINFHLRKKRSDNELPAGPIIPIVDQLPLANSTFDVKINDKFNEDIVFYNEMYPNAINRDVIKDILPQWKGPDSDYVPKKTRIMFF